MVSMIKYYINKLTGKLEELCGPQKRDCELFDLLKLRKIDESEFPYEKFRSILEQYKNSEAYNVTHVTTRNCPAKVYEEGKYRKGLIYSTNEDCVSNVFYTQREDGFYEITYIPSDCKRKLFHTYPPVKLQFLKLSMKYRHKDLQDIRDFVIFKELL